MKDGKATAITDTCDSLSGIDSCLSGLYNRAMEHEHALPTVKAVLLNLIIYAADEALAEEAMEHVSQILPSVPCRAIIAEITSSLPAEGATVSVMCGISERGDRRLCGEVINVHAVRGTVTGSVMPLLIPDVPVCLWVLGDIPPEKEDFDDLLRVSSHVIVDSRKFADLNRGLRAVDRLRTGDGGSRIVQDLAWVSLHPWREATAEHFDAPSVRSYLARIQSVGVSYSGSNASPYPESAPLLFAAWLIERTQLKLQHVFHAKDGGFLLDAAQDGDSVNVRVVPEDSRRTVGELLSVAIDCRSDEGLASFATERVSDTELGLTEECREVCLPPKNMEVAPEDDAALVVQALRSYGRDRVLESALEVALKILAQIELADESASSVRL